MVLGVEQYYLITEKKLKQLMEHKLPDKLGLDGRRVGAKDEDGLRDGGNDEEAPMEDSSISTLSAPSMNPSGEERMQTGDKGLGVVEGGGRVDVVASSKTVGRGLSDAELSLSRDNTIGTSSDSFNGRSSTDAGMEAESKRMKARTIRKASTNTWKKSNIRSMYPTVRSVREKRAKVRVQWITI